MNENWQSALKKSAEPILIDLSGMGVVDVVGPEAQSFLQDQVCNDLLDMANNEAKINGYCHPKGRLLALFTVFAIYPSFF